MNAFESLAARHALASRRGFVDPSGGLSAVGLALLAQQSYVVPAEESECTPSGGAALRDAHQAESRVIGLYQDLLESNVLDAPGRTLAVLFQRHHLSHVAALERILRMRGEPQAPGADQAARAGEIASPTEAPAALVQLARQERASCQSHLQGAAHCPGDVHASLLMRLAAQCAVHYGALALATGEPLEA